MKIFPNIVINFHAIHDEKWLDNVLSILKQNYNIISIKELEQFFYEGKKLKNCCHITIDDGHKSFYEVFFPLLKKYQIPASLFVSPMAIREQKNFWFQEIKGYDEKVLLDIIKNDHAKTRNVGFDSTLKSYLKNMDVESIWGVINRYQEITSTPAKPCVNLTVDQLLELNNSDYVNIGAHTQTHPILSNESDEKSYKELKDSIYELGDLLNKPILYFAYPNGEPGTDFGEREINTLSQLDIKLAFSIEKKSFKKGDSPISIPRNGFSKGNRMYVLTKLALGKHWDSIKKLLK